MALLADLTSLFPVIPLLLVLAVYAFPRWHVQWISTLVYFFFLRHRIPEQYLEPNLLFAPVHRSVRCSIFDYDMFGHKSNSTYFLDADISMAETLSRLTGPSFRLRRAQGKLAFPRLGGVGGIFLKEIKLWQKYVVKSRIAGWDDRWLYLINRFEATGPASEANAEKRVLAIIITKGCYKERRTTIPPQVVLEESGLIPLPEQEEDQANGAGTHKDKSGKMDALGNANGKGWSRERIEEERVKGLALAKSLLSLDTVPKDNWDHYGKMTSLW